MKPCDLVKYKRVLGINEEEHEERRSWMRIKDFVGILLPPDPLKTYPHLRILWNTGEIMLTPIPPYDPELHFEVIREHSHPLMVG